MISVADAYGALLVLLGGWGAFTTSLTVRGPGWRKRRGLVLSGASFAASCFLPGIALLADGFRIWMLLPLGACYLGMIPGPCYFRWANRPGRIRAARAALFACVGAALIAAGLGWLPVSWFGL